MFFNLKGHDFRKKKDQVWFLLLTEKYASDSRTVAGFYLYKKSIYTQYRNLIHQTYLLLFI